METLDICIATHRIVKGNGIDISVLEFARALSRRHNVTLAVNYTDTDCGGLEVLKCRVSLRSGLRAAAGDLKRRRFDLISTHYSPFDLVAALSGIPHYLHDPGIPPFGVLKGVSGKYLWAAVNGGRLLSARSARCVLPISGYLGGQFRRKYLYRGRMETLPYGIDFPAELPDPEVPYERYVLYVGRHTPYKGVDTLIRIFGEVREELGDDVHLVTIGHCDEGYRPYLDALGKKAGNVHMLGFVPDVWGYYARASAYATCSLWEGQDRPVIEAQYAGVPAVTFNNCSHPEVVERGTLAGDRRAFREALAGYLRERRPGPAKDERIRDKYSPEGMVRKFGEIAGDRC
ncbi:MAG: Glycosyltransferase Gtf1 [Methanocella sp. PtaU1.Bin125]|nr:MAG: Glycosyltransferase Gtf1 [Methanocella sp. PtaU1.Bin125]